MNAINFPPRVLFLTALLTCNALSAQSLWNDLGYATRSSPIAHVTATNPIPGKTVDVLIRAKPGAYAFVVVGFSSRPTPLPGGGTIIPSVDLMWRTTTDSNGKGTLRLPPMPHLQGQPLFLQVGILSRNVLTVSNALEGKIATPKHEIRHDPLPPTAPTFQLSEGSDVTDHDVLQWKKKWLSGGYFDLNALEKRFRPTSTIPYAQLNEWADYEDISALGMMYEATGDLDILAKWKSLNDILYLNRAVNPTMDTRRNVWTTGTWLGYWNCKQDKRLHNSAYIGGNGIYAHSLAWFARIVVEDPGLHAVYGDIAVDYINAARKTAKFFNDVDLRDSLSTQRDHPSNYYHSVSYCKPLPSAFNNVHTLARAMVECHRAMRNKFYRGHRRYENTNYWAQMYRFPAVLAGLTRRFMNPHSKQLNLVGDRYEWPYREEVRAPFTTKDDWIFEDASHGGVTIRFLTLLHRDKRVLNQYLQAGSQIRLGASDLQRFANTFLFMSSERNRIKHRVDGSEISGKRPEWANTTTMDWLALAPYDNRVYSRCERIAIRHNWLVPEVHSALLHHKASRFKNVQISYSGGSGWNGLRHSDSTNAGQLAVGEFDGNGYADLFRVQRGHWTMADGLRGTWKPLGPNATPVYQVEFGDFDGDGKTDVFRSDNGRWEISWSANGTWSYVGYSGIASSSFRFGDFDGDGCTDIFRTGAQNGCTSRTDRAPAPSE